MSLIYHSGIGYSEDLCEDITSWFLNTFFPNHGIEVEIIHSDLSEEDCNGVCDFVGNATSNPREFVIELNSNMEHELYAKTLLHELTHLAQWVRGDLQMKRGKIYYLNEPASNYDYVYQPHEILAREEENRLLDWWICDHNDMPVEQVAQLFATPAS